MSKAVNKTIYFLGIGGIGMSALARYFKYMGYHVSGYDKIETALTRELTLEGIVIHYHEDISCIPESPELVIYTPAIPNTHQELTFIKQQNFTLKKRAEVLGEISSQYFSMAIAGTHGKTTITGLVAHIFKTAGIPIVGFVGGIMKNYNSNLLLDYNAQVFIAEADEYDRSFLQLNPDMAVVSSIDADHLDVYSDKTNLKNTYTLFMSKVKLNGVLLTKKGLVEKQSGVVHYEYSVNEPADFYATNIEVHDSIFTFVLHMLGTEYKTQLRIPGKHNVENAVAAAGICFSKGLTPAIICKGLESYQGICRRFDYIIRSEKVIFIDDYAHHPEELNAFICAVKQVYPDKKITGVFQPHLYSRTLHFAAEFARALEQLDTAILLPIYPARELPIEGVSSQIIFDKMSIADKYLLSKNQLFSFLNDNHSEVVVSMGAGDIDQLVQPIHELLNNKYHE